MNPRDFVVFFLIEYTLNNDTAHISTYCGILSIEIR